MGTYDEGSTVTEAGEEVARKHFPRNGTLLMQVYREAGLTGDLTGVTYRRLKAIRLWFGTRDPKHLVLSREELAWLRDACDAALAATEEFADAGTIEYREGEQP